MTAGIGGLLFDPTGRAVKLFVHKLDDLVVAARTPGSERKTAIFECELWGSDFSDAVVIFTDNNGVRDTLISCNARSKIARDILTATLAVESTSQITPWYARVPTDSNIANDPSRFSCDKLLSLGAVQCIVDGGSCWAEVSALSESWGEKQGSSQPSFNKM